jgi:hypothetical protein
MCWKELRDWLTLLFVILTTVGIFGQARIFHNQLIAFDSEARIRLRAYLSVAASHDPVEVGKTTNFNVLIQASGQTPAFDVEGWGVSGIGAYPLPAGYHFEEKNAKERVNISLSPGNTISVMLQMNINQEMYDLIKGQTQRAYVWGNVRYRDVFGCSRWQNFCFSANDTPGRTDPCAEHNEAEGEPGACPVARVAF